MGFESGRAAAARKWIASAYVDSQALRQVIDAFPQVGFYRATDDDDFAQRANVVLPEWYRLQRKSLIGPYIEEPGAVWDARFRFGRCDFAMPHDGHFRDRGDRDWFLFTHFGYSSDEDRRHLHGGCGLLPIGVRFGYHLHLAISLRKVTDKRIYAVHLDEVGDAVAAGQTPKPQPVFRSYASMLNAIVEVRKGGDGEIVSAS